MTTQKNYNLAINGLRGLCILMVFIYHVVNSGIVPAVDLPFYDYFLHFLTTFRYGVEIFFMISGYVIYKSLKRHTSFKKFILDRFIRIHPTWVPILICLFIFGPILGRGVFETFDPLVWSGTFLSNLFFLPPIVPFPLAHPAAWSLSYEWFFYLVGGVSIYVLLPKLRLPVALALIATISIIFFNYFPRGLFFVSGVIVSIYEQQIRQNSRLFIAPSLFLAAFLLSWIATGADRAEISETIYDYAMDGRFLYLVLAFIFGTYMFATITIGNGLITKVLDTQVFQFLGNISYAFYLWSPVCMMVGKMLAVKLVTPHFGDWAGVAFFSASSLVASLMVSYINWLLIEQRFTKYLKTLLSKREETAHAG